MSTSSNTLLALLLTLQDLEEHLSPSEQNALKQIGSQLSLDPDAWESDIYPELLDLVEGNAAWMRLFTTTKTKLDGLGDNIPEAVLPTPEEVENALPSSGTPAERGFKPKGAPGSGDNQIHNMAVRILTTPNPSETTKKVSGLGKLKEFLG